MCYKRKGLESWLFCGFCHHPVTTTSVHMHAYRYPLFESGTGKRLIFLTMIIDVLLAMSTDN